MGRFVEPKEIHSKISKAHELIVYIAENGSQIMRDSTLQQYEDTLDLLQNCENVLSSVINAQKMRKMSVHDFSETRYMQNVNSKPAEIMRNYRTRLSSLRSSKFSSSDISCCVSSLYDWFVLRFKSSEDSTFKYNPSKICNYIDEFIIAYGHFIHADNISEFETNMYQWSESINSPSTVQYPLPKFIHDIYLSSDCVAAEAVVLENEIKSSLYDNTFNEDKRDTILTMYRQVWADVSFDTIKARSKI